MKPQLARSASKTRGLRAPELGDAKKVEIDFLEMTPTRPPQLAPVKVNSPSLRYSVLSIQFF